MPVPDAAPSFAEAAAADGIVLAQQQTLDWFTEAGHLGLESVAMSRRDPSLREPVTEAAELLSAMYDQFGGDRAVLRSLRVNYLVTIDLIHEATGTVVELDESPHFTSFRRTTLDLYPADAALAFDLDEYRTLCDEWARESDKYERSFAAKGFRIGGRARERAYRDALLDLGAPAMKLPPVFRVVALDGDGAAAYARDRERLARALA
jgi:hypothetical protein